MTDTKNTVTQPLPTPGAGSLMLNKALRLARQGLNFVTGQDRKHKHFLAFWSAAFEAAQASKCGEQIAEPAATQQAPLAMDAKRFLNESDYEDLWRFEGMAWDGEGYDISKDRMKRLAELGVVRWCGKDRYSITAFGQYVLEASMVNLPLETYEEASARCNAEFKERIDRLKAQALAAQVAQSAKGAVA